MNEAEARELANKINRHPGWFARAGGQPFINRDNHDWWVWAHHDTMRAVVSGTPYPELPITTPEEWEAARLKWHN